MAAFTSIMPPSSLEAALLPLATFTDTQIASLTEAISGRRSFSLSKSELEKLQRQVSIPRTELSFLLGALGLLYLHISELVESGTDFEQAVTDTLEALDEETFGPELKENLRPKLLQLLKMRANHKLFRKIQRLQTGFLPNGVAFSSFVDLRPNFEGDNGEKIVGNIVTIQFRVSTDSTDPTKRHLVFQLSEDGLNELKKALDRVERKVAILRDTTNFSLIEG